MNPESYIIVIKGLLSKRTLESKDCDIDDIEKWKQEIEKLKNTEKYGIFYDGKACSVK